MRLWVSESFFVVDLPFVDFYPFHSVILFVGSLIPGEVRGRGRSLVEITSSDPIFESTPVVPKTVPDVDTVTDSDYVASALNSIDTLLTPPRKRDGTVMFQVGGAPSTPPRNELVTHAMAMDVALLQESRIVDDPTQVMEPVGKNRKLATSIKSWQTTPLRRRF